MKSRRNCIGFVWVLTAAICPAQRPPTSVPLAPPSVEQFAPGVRSEFTLTVFDLGGNPVPWAAIWNGRQGVFQTDADGRIERIPQDWLHKHSNICVKVPGHRAVTARIRRTENGEPEPLILPFYVIPPVESPIQTKSGSSEESTWIVRVVLKLVDMVTDHAVEILTVSAIAAIAFWLRRRRKGAPADQAIGSAQAGP